MEPELLFLDIQMPGANGFELLEQLDRVPLVIFTTAYDEWANGGFLVRLKESIEVEMSRRQAQKFKEAMSL